MSNKESKTEETITVLGTPYKVKIKQVFTYEIINTKDNVIEGDSYETLYKDKETCKNDALNFVELLSIRSEEAYYNNSEENQ
jgi:hypothetical protein